MKSFTLMQPHFFPYIGYFYLIFSSDSFVFYDTAQFSHQSWQCRNRVLDHDGVVRMISVPICRSSKFQPISEVNLSNGRFIDFSSSFKALINRIEAYYMKAPHYTSLKEFLHGVCLNIESSSLLRLNMQIIESACKELSTRIGKAPRFYLFSDVMAAIPEFMTIDRVRRIGMCASILNCDEYLTTLGSVHYMLSSQHISDLDSVSIKVLTGNYIRYQQNRGRGSALPYFEENLSILDLIACVGWDGIANLLLSHDLFKLEAWEIFCD